MNKLQKSIDEFKVEASIFKDNLDCCSMFIKNVEKMISDYGVNLPFTFLVDVDQGEAEWHLCWDIDDKKKFRLMVQVGGKGLYNSMPLIESKIEVRFRLAKYLASFISAFKDYLIQTRIKIEESI